MIKVHDVIGAYAIKQEHGEELASSGEENFDFAEVKVFCSNFWTGFFRGCRQYDNIVFENFLFDEVLSIEKICKGIWVEGHWDFSRHPAVDERRPVGRLAISVHDPVSARRADLSAYAQGLYDQANSRDKSAMVLARKVTGKDAAWSLELLRESVIIDS